MRWKMSLSLCVLSLDFLRALDPLSFTRTRVLYICVYRRGSSGFARKGIITWDSPGRERERESGGISISKAKGGIFFRERIFSLGHMYMCVCVHGRRLIY